LAAAVELNELSPNVGLGFAEVGKGHILVRRAPHRVGSVVEVRAEEALNLPGTEHEVKGEMGGRLEVEVHRG
jgi:hypothetical protein